VFDTWGHTAEGVRQEIDPFSSTIVLVLDLSFATNSDEQIPYLGMDVSSDTTSRVNPKKASFSSVDLVHKRFRGTSMDWITSQR
jgi:hypothetical protein